MCVSDNNKYAVCLHTNNVLSFLLCFAKSLVINSDVEWADSIRFDQRHTDTQTNGFSFLYILSLLTLKRWPICKEHAFVGWAFVDDGRNS